MRISLSVIKQLYITALNRYVQDTATRLQSDVCFLIPSGARLCRDNRDKPPIWYISSNTSCTVQDVSMATSSGKGNGLEVRAAGMTLGCCCFLRGRCVSLNFSVTVLFTQTVSTGYVFIQHLA